MGKAPAKGAAPTASKRRPRSRTRGHDIERLSRTAEENGLTDTYMAERFVVQHGRDWHYDHDRKSWLTFRDREHRWRPEEPGEVTRLAIQTARDFLPDARKIRDDRLRERALSFGKFCQQLPGIRRV